MLKPWREIAIPNEEVRKGTFQQAELAADLWRLHEGSATADNRDPRRFFERTYITEGMGIVLQTAVERLAGRGGAPVVQLQTPFGGGKTHCMMAVHHLARGEAPARELAGVSAILDRARVPAPPRANVVVLDGVVLAPNLPRVRGESEVGTLWGELAWQLGGADGYALVREADASGTSPGQAVLVELLTRYAPCVILVDELVAWLRQLDDAGGLAGGTYEANMSFVQAVTQALKAVPNALMLVSLPLSGTEAGGPRGERALASLEHVFARVQETWKPVAPEEAFEIVRRRLFETPRDRAAMEAVCDAFADMYLQHAAHVPSATQTVGYRQRLQRAYPIHPELLDRLYDDWSTLDGFQRTRGVLRLMARVVHRLWEDGSDDLLIMPGSLPLHDAIVRIEAVKVLPAGWEPVIEGDIDGQHAETTQIETGEPYFGSAQACRRVARTVFLGSAPTAGRQACGLDGGHVLLGSMQPGQAPGVFDDALQRLGDRLHFLHQGNHRWWFDTRVNLLREMEERKKRFDLREDVFPRIGQRLQGVLDSGFFGGVHVFAQSADVPDDTQLRLVVLPPDAGHRQGRDDAARDRAREIVETRGSQPRRRQNRLVFLAADADSAARLYDLTRSVMAWASILDDHEAQRLALDARVARTAEASHQTAVRAMERMVVECYRWLLAPVQPLDGATGRPAPVVWESLGLQTGAADLACEIERRLTENEWVVVAWSPLHLADLCRRWLWKEGAPHVGALDVWEMMACYLYLPRLREEGVYRETVAAGATCRDYFGLACGTGGGRYEGFRWGAGRPVSVDGRLVLIDPLVAEKVQAETMPPPVESQDAHARHDDGSLAADPRTLAPPPPVLRRSFHGEIDLDPHRMCMQVSDLHDGIVQHLTALAGAGVTISLEIRATRPQGFDSDVIRIVTENCDTLRFRDGAGFEEG